MELIKQLMENLGVSEEQAKGGAGTVLKTAKDNLSGEQFDQVAKAVPGIGDLIGFATSKSSSTGGGLLGSVTGALGGGGGLGNLATLAKGFSNFGLDGEMVGKFLPIILSFVQSKGGDKVKSLLASVLK
jgi:hypothetical protein